MAIIGLDCVTPQLLFRDLANETPNIHKLMSNGMHGDLASITPPITVPAWACARPCRDLLDRREPGNNWPRIPRWQ